MLFGRVDIIQNFVFHVDWTIGRNFDDGVLDIFSLMSILAKIYYILIKICNVCQHLKNIKIYIAKKTLRLIGLLLNLDRLGSYWTNESIRQIDFW